MEKLVKQRIKDVLEHFNTNPNQVANKNSAIQRKLSRQIEGGSALSYDVIEIIAQTFPSISSEWLMTGQGNMLKSDSTPTETKPRIPYNAKAGVLTESVSGVRGYECEQIPVISAFPHYDFTIQINGDSMQPDYCSGDEVACAIIREPVFLQWGRVHVLDTEQGVVIKKIYDEGENIRCRSINKDDYPDFSIPKDKIRLFALVVGQLRLK